VSIVYLPHFPDEAFGWRWIFNIGEDDCEIVTYGVETEVVEDREPEVTTVETVHLHRVGSVPARNIALVRQELETDLAQMIDMQRSTKWILDTPWFDKGAMGRADASGMILELMSAGVVEANEVPGSSLYMDQTRVYTPPPTVRIWSSDQDPWALMDSLGISQPDKIEEGAEAPPLMSVEEVDDSEE
jgi:hypothetical protein